MMVTVIVITNCNKDFTETKHSLNNLVWVFWSAVGRTQLLSSSHLHTSRSEVRDRRSTCVSVHTLTSNTCHRNTGHTVGSDAAITHTYPHISNIYIHSNYIQVNLAFNTVVWKYQLACKPHHNLPDLQNNLGSFRVNSINGSSMTASEFDEICRKWASTIHKNTWNISEWYLNCFQRYKHLRRSMLVRCCAFLCQQHQHNTIEHIY